MIGDKKENWKKNAQSVEVRLLVKRMLLLVGVPAYQNYQKMKLVTVIVCAKIVYKKNIEKDY